MLMPKRAYYNENIRCYSDGKIERLDKRKGWREVKQTCFNHKGYLMIRINGKTMRWHRVIWIAFNGAIPNGLEINHIDENKTNNSLENLEIVTREDNLRYGTRTERSARTNTNGKCSKPVIGINIETGEKIEFPSTQEAQRNGFHSSNICACIKGKRKSHNGYRWYYRKSYEKGGDTEC